MGSIPDYKTVSNHAIATLMFMVVFNTHVLGFYQLKDEDSLYVMQLIDSAYSLKEIDYHKAVRIGNESIERAHEFNSAYLKQASLYTSAMLDWYNGDHQQGLKKCRKSIIYSAELDDTYGKANNSSMMGLIYLYMSDYDSSLFYFENALQFYSIIKDTTQILKSRGFMGLVYEQQADYVKAKENLLATVVLKKQHNTSNWSVLKLSDKADVNTKYYEESLINAKENLLKLGELPTMELRNAYHNVGLAYLKLGYPDSALISYKHSALVSMELGADVFWIDYASAFTEVGKYDSAIWCNQNAIESAKENGTRIGLANAYNILANTFKSKQELDSADYYYKLALRLHTGMRHKNTRANILRYLAEVYLKKNRLTLALHYADSSGRLANKIGAQYGYVRALKTSFDILQLQGNYKKALEIMEKQVNLEDTLQKGKVQLDLAKLDLYNEVELNKLEISDLNKQQALSNANLKNRTLVIIIISIVVLFVVLLLVLNHFKTQKLRVLNVELSHQQDVISSQNNKLTESNEEKELLLGEIHHRVKNNLQTITSLLNIQQRKLKDPDSIKVLEDSKNRVIAMGLIHQHLYQNSSFAEIDFKNYTKELVNVLINTNAYCDIVVQCNIPELKIELDNAIFFGLIINELAINSIKHAYDGVENPFLEISIFEESGKMALLVKDNGNEENIDFDKSNSFGWKMVNNICDKLDAKLVVNNLDGLSVKILFHKSIIDIK